MHPTPETQPAATIFAPVPIGELLDKITILEIKSVRIQDPKKLENVANERRALEAIARQALRPDAEVDRLMDALREVNQSLWDIEDAIREHEARQDFGASFIALARSVYQSNDRRAALKSAVNRVTGSSLTEEKSYKG